LTDHERAPAHSPTQHTHGRVDARLEHPGRLTTRAITTVQIEHPHTRAGHHEEHYFSSVLGAPAELVDLIQATGVELTRAEWLRLHGAGIVSVDAVQETPIERLSEVVGSKESAQRLIEAAAEAASALAAESIELPEPSE
jgi:hypothetical protein